MKLLFAVRNVAAHADEMREAAPAEPAFFLKPESALVRGGELALPDDMGEIHHEVELAVEVTTRLRRATAAQAGRAIGRVGVVLDLTAREHQATLKAASLPWTEAKGFDGACVLGPLIEVEEPAAQTVRLAVNGVERQRFRVADYQVGPAALLARASRWMTLEPGDVLGCGTGAGVGPLVQGDTLVAELEGADDSRLVATVVSGPKG